MCGALAACALGGAGAAAQQQPVFRGRGDAVRVFVTVTDRDGRLVTTLAQDDFEVRDEGKPQPITLFDNTPQPIRLIVMLDVSGSMEGNLPLLRAAARAALRAAAARRRRARRARSAREITISPTFTRDARELRAALPELIAPDAPTPLWRALDEAMDAFDRERRAPRDPRAERRQGQRADELRVSVPSARPRSSTARGDEDVMIYAIGMRSRSTQPTTPGIGPVGCRRHDAGRPARSRARARRRGDRRRLHRDSFGQDLGAAFARVADELHTQYLLGFAPPKRDGKVHDIDVRVSSRGLKPRARKSYVAPERRTR